MKILVTGGAGFIGSHIADELCDMDCDVSVLDNLSTHYSIKLKEKNVTSVKKRGGFFSKLDLARDAIHHHLKDVDVIIHCAAQPGISTDISFNTYLKNNKIATHRIMEAVNDMQSKAHTIYISTSSVYGLEATGPEHSEPKPASDYGVTKLAAEQLVLSHARQNKLNATSLRLFSVYGPRERPEKLFTKLIHAAETNQPFPLYEGSREHVRSFTYVGDVVRAIRQVLENKDACNQEIINIGSDHTNTTGEAIQAVEQAVGKDIQFEMQPPRAGDQSKTSANIDKARKLLGYEPKTKLTDGVRKQVAWYRENNIQDLL